VILRSKKLSSLAGVVHGFSTRQGGVSVGAFASLNLARNVGDVPESVEENRRRLLAAIGAEAFAEADQVHGARLIDAERGGSLGVEADGLITAVPRLAVAVRTADCASILLAAIDARGRATSVAAVHAGWRGATLGIATVAAHGLLGLEKGARVIAAIGPTIGVSAFEVGDEVVAAARASLDGDAPPIQRGPSGSSHKWHLDLRALIALHLARAGVTEIDQVGGCTVSEPEMYFSHRRDRGVTGRHLSAIALKQ